MNNGTVLARNEAGRNAIERLRHLPKEGGRRKLLTRAFITSWGGFAICLTALIMIGEGRHEGLAALVLMLSLIGLVCTFFAGIVVTGTIAVTWLVGQVQPAQGNGEPQDAVASAALASTSLVPVVLLSGCWIFLMIVGAITAGASGFATFLVLGPIVAVFAVFKLGVLDQRIEVAPHEVRVRTLFTNRTIPASAVTDLEFIDFDRSNPDQPLTRLVLHLMNGTPISLAGNFVSDRDRAREFVAASRTILKLDDPQDAPFEVPQDTITHQ